jgi:hypothetical protein
VVLKEALVPTELTEERQDRKLEEVTISAAIPHAMSLAQLQVHKAQA